MLFNEIFSTRSFSPQLAEKYGFIKDGEDYILRKELAQEGFYAVIRTNERSLEVNVYEEPDDEEYLPFNARAASGGFVGAIRTQSKEIVNEIALSCFVLSDVKQLLVEYCIKKHGSVLNAPWDYLKEYHTLNSSKNNKWYALFMLIPYRYLGVEKEGKINVLNLKAQPEDIPGLIDNEHYFPAYHMNKKYWISVLLDKTADVEFVKRLLDKSLELVEKKTKNKK